MDATEANRYVLEQAKSTSLSDAFHCVLDATTPEGEPRYPAWVKNVLARHIVTRTYSMLLREACHLVNIADACRSRSVGYEGLVFGTARAIPDSFKAHVEDAIRSGGWQRSGFRNSSRGVSIGYQDAIAHVSYARMPLLVAFIDFLFTTLDYPKVDSAFRSMLASPSHRTAGEDAASAIERQLYTYLSNHLPSVHSQRKLVQILSYFRSREQNATVSIDDEAILDFWRAQSGDLPDGKASFRLYRLVVEGFVEFARTLEAAQDRQAVRYARGDIGEARTVDGGPVGDTHWSDSIGDWRSPLDALEQQPASRVKFLTKRESDDLEFLLRLGPYAERLPLSLLRAEVFGACQGRIVQALRRESSPKILLDLIACGDAVHYEEQAKLYADLRHQIKRLIDAAGYVVLRRFAGNETPLADGLETNIPELDTAGLRAAIVNAKRTFSRIARKGFDQASLDDEEMIAAFEAGSEALLTIGSRLDAYLKVLARMDSADKGLARRFADDLAAFHKQFERLYEGRIDDAKFSVS